MDRCQGSPKGEIRGKKCLKTRTLNQGSQLLGREAWGLTFSLSKWYPLTERAQSSEQKLKGKGDPQESIKNL